MIFHGIRTSIAKKPFFCCDISGGLDPLPPSGSEHQASVAVHLKAVRMPLGHCYCCSHCTWRFCGWHWYGDIVLWIISSFSIIVLKKRELVALLKLYLVVKVRAFVCFLVSRNHSIQLMHSYEVNIRIC